jgi:hypothetical protein
MLSFVSLGEKQSVRHPESFTKASAAGRPRVFFPFCSKHDAVPTLSQ